MDRDETGGILKATARKKQDNSKKPMTLQALTAFLGISRGTAKNWIKSGRIEPIGYEKGELVFLKGQVEALKCQLENSQVNYLKSRRNKRFKKGTIVPKGYIKNGLVQNRLIRFAEAIAGYPLDELTVRLIMAEAALQRLAHRGFVAEITDDWGYTAAFFEGSLCLDQIEPLIGDLLAGVCLEDHVALSQGLIPLPDLAVDFNEDVLGLLYMMLQCVSTRKGRGVYYTPFEVANETVDALQSAAGGQVIGSMIDPCCGTGQFLLAYLNSHLACQEGRVGDGCPYSQCHGYDIDPISVLLTRLNIVIATGYVNLDTLYRQFQLRDTLLDTSEMTFDCILGNPPWGYVFDKKQQSQLKERYQLAQNTRVESFALFIEWAEHHLNQGGWLGFVLPESTLMVKAHLPLREMIRSSFMLHHVNFLDYRISGVVVPTIIMIMGKKTVQLPFESNTSESEGVRPDLARSRWTPDGSFLVRPSDEVYALIQTIEKRRYTTLKHQGVFAMGIVTGDNGNFLTQESGTDRVPILRGADVSPYQIVDSGVFIRLGHEYQQSAPTKLYYAKEKLVYRFIADQPIVALDDRQRLTLNSCNCLIPKVPGYSMQVIMAVLNASVSAFYYKNRFSSVKVLKSHLEDMPIPPLTEAQKKDIESWVACLTSTRDPKTAKLYLEQIDRLIADAFGLTSKQLNLVESQFSSPIGDETVKRR